MLDRLAEYLKEIFTSRLVPIFIMFFALFFILIIRMFNLQIVKSNEVDNTEVVSDEKQRDIQSTRGNIYDKNGILLASNVLSYSVTIEDTGTLGTNEKKNEMINKMVSIIYDNEDKLDIDFPIGLNKKNEYYFKNDEAAQLRFKRDAYFAKSIDALTEEQKNASAADVIDYFMHDISSTGPKFDISDSYTKKEVLDIIRVRYTMMINSTTRYIPITVSKDVKDNTVVAIKENSDELPGVKISQATKRLYYDSKYFSNIIGYTGGISQDDLATVKENYPNYNYTTSDQIGKAGIELGMEKTLRGKKGSETLVIDGNSRITSVKDVKDPVAGSDIYLTIDSELQKACYNILEKELAGILISKLNNSTSAGTKGESASDIRIPIYDVYNAVFYNNIVDTKKFSSKNASTVEKQVYKKYVAQKKQVIKKLKKYLSYGYKIHLSNHSEEYQAYMNYIYSMLKDNNMILKDSIDTSSEEYTKFAKGNLSLSNFLEYAIINNDINYEALGIGDNLYTTKELYDILIEYIFDKIDNNKKFDKIIYKYMIYSYKISGTEVCMLLINQKIVKASDDTVNGVLSGSIPAYNFIKSKIISLELTPAMLALEPCSGSIVITDVNNGDVLAYVSYPTYDNNKLANEIDSDYYAKLLDDASYPLMNRPSMQKTAPGSTFKMVSATAALEEDGILKGPLEKILDEHEFKEINPSPKCWSSTSHGKIDVTGALRDSCNYFFYEVGYRLGLNDNEVFVDDKGLKTLEKYAKIYGFDAVSGLELSEAEPQISDYDGIRSAIGQGKNNYAPVQLARYVTTLANSGSCFDLTLVDKTVSRKGKEKDKSAKIHNQVSVDPSTWTYIHNGMRKVITKGSISGLYKDLKVDVAGKTGTAQESDTKPNHALFVSYAPYNSPEISVTTVIPNGYTSGNAAELARDIYTYIYDEESRNELLNRKVRIPENQSNAFSD